MINVAYLRKNKSTFEQSVKQSINHSQDITLSKIFIINSFNI